MKLKNLPGTDLEISEVVLGSDYYGESIDADTAASFMDYFIENGGNTIDTARLYTGGKSEAVIGAYLKDRGIRDRIVISTKCAHPPLGNMQKSRLSREEIEYDIDLSLSALGTDHIDLLWLHRDDKSVPVGGIIESLNEMVKKGKIRYFGASNWCGERLCEANRYAEEKGLMGFSASQIQWSAAVPAINYDATLVSMNETEYEYYKKSRMPVFAFSAQAKGFFEKYDKGCLSEKAKFRYLCDENVERYRMIKNISEQTGYSISSVVLSAITNNPDFVSLPIINCSRLSQLEDSLGVLKIKEQLLKLF